MNQIAPHLRVRSTLAVVASAAALLACASSRTPYVPPATPVAPLRTIATLPFYGLTVDSPSQDKLGAYWADYWRSIYPGTQWLPMSETAAMLQAGGALPAWSAQERAYMQTGLVPVATVHAICRATGTDAVAQPTVFHAQAGSGARLFLFRPLFGAGGELAGAARVAMAVYTCETGERVWHGAEEITYSGNYTQLQFVEYAFATLARQIPQ